MQQALRLSSLSVPVRNRAVHVCHCMHKANGDKFSCLLPALPNNVHLKSEQARKQCNRAHKPLSTTGTPAAQQSMHATGCWGNMPMQKLRACTAGTRNQANHLRVRVRSADAASQGIAGRAGKHKAQAACWRAIAPRISATGMHKERRDGPPRLRPHLPMCS
jgi:hypothetical protein